MANGAATAGAGALRTLQPQTGRKLTPGRMNILDLLLLVVLLAALSAGFRIGFVARVTAWIGAVAGFVLALRLMPNLLRELQATASATRLLLTVGVLLVGAAIGSAVGEAIGIRLRGVVPRQAAGIDRAGGAVAGLVSVLVSLWLFLPVVSQVPLVAGPVRNSEILQRLEDFTPQAPEAARQLRSLVTEARFPEVFADLRPAPDMGRPPADVPVPTEVVARAVQSTVNVESFGCGGLHEGSGFAVATNLIATNAHVVAGADRLQVRRPDGRVLPASIVTFDPNRDLALLSVPGLGQPPLPLGNAPVETPAAVLGYPGGQNKVRVAPAAVQDERATIGRDIYGRNRTQRQVLFLASRIRQGDSGSALIDPQGRVIGVAFAIAPDRSGTAYALDDSELRAVLAMPRRASAGGPCI